MHTLARDTLELIKNNIPSMIWKAPWTQIREALHIDKLNIFISVGEEAADWTIIKKSTKIYILNHEGAKRRFLGVYFAYFNF